MNDTLQGLKMINFKSSSRIMKLRHGYHWRDGTTSLMAYNKELPVFSQSTVTAYRHAASVRNSFLRFFQFNLIDGCYTQASLWKQWASKKVWKDYSYLTIEMCRGTSQLHYNYNVTIIKAPNKKYMYISIGRVAFPFFYVLWKLFKKNPCIQAYVCVYSTSNNKYYGAKADQQPDSVWTDR